MKVILSSRAEKQLRKLAKIDQIAIAKKIRELGNDTNSLQKEKLQGFRDIFRVRVGNYRIVLRSKINELYIIIIGHRKDIYRLLKQLFD